jgi:hypothetical protein
VRYAINIFISLSKGVTKVLLGKRDEIWLFPNQIKEEDKLIISFLSFSGAGINI